MDTQQTTNLAIDGVSLYTSYQKAPHTRQDKLSVVILHGAGTSNSERFAAVAQHFLDAGVSVVALDFLGHGKTGGNLQDNSLALRNTHALAVIGHWLTADTPLILLGSSMGAHTALRISSQLGNRLQGLCLLQPAIYAREAEPVRFTSEFTEILRRSDSWQSSLALQDARECAKRAYLGIGSADAVIPWGVVQALSEAFRHQADPFRLEVLHGAGHDLPEWLPRHPGTVSTIVHFFTHTNRTEK